MPPTPIDQLYSRVRRVMWRRDPFIQLSGIPPCGQGLWLYLLTCPEQTAIPGVIVAGRAQLAECLAAATGHETWLSEFGRLLLELEAQGMALADWKARLVWLPGAVALNRPDNPNVVKGWAPHFDTLPDCDLKDQLLAALEQFVEPFGERFVEGFQEGFAKPLQERLGKPLPKPGVKPRSKQGRNREREREGEREGGGCIGSAGSEPRCSSRVEGEGCGEGGGTLRKPVENAQDGAASVLSSVENGQTASVGGVNANGDTGDEAAQTPCLARRPTARAGRCEPAARGFLVDPSPVRQGGVCNPSPTARRGSVEWITELSRKRLCITECGRRSIPGEFFCAVCRKEHKDWSVEMAVPAPVHPLVREA